MRPVEAGSPFVSRVQLRPPSRVRKIPPVVPPAVYDHAVRRRAYIAAYSVFGSPGSIARSTAPVSASTFSTWVQVLPPSVVLKIPRSGLSFHSRPSAATYTVLLSVGCGMTREIVDVASRPMDFQVAPPSPERNTPRPHEEELRLFASPVPTHTTSGFFCHTATEPIEATGCLSNIGFHVVPAFVVLKTPPVP